MSAGLKNLKRYKELAALLWKYGRFSASDEDVDEPASPSGTPKELADELERMGPTYVKIGQVLSGRPDLLPPAYLEALSRLQDDVKPFPYEQVVEIVERELGTRISKAFATFTEKPLAAASLGQVHAATLRDGTEVVVKVQRPGIREQIADDFTVLLQAASFVDRRTAVGRRNRFARMVEEFRDSIHQELDFEREARNLTSFAESLREFDRIRVPRPIQDYCSRSVLTMEHVRGHKLTTLSPVVRLELCNAELVEQLFRAYLKQVLIDGAFHADPHPGNLLLTDEGQIALLDLGMVGHLAPEMQEHLLQLMIAVTEKKAEDAADVVLQISEKTDEFDPTSCRRRLTQLVTARQENSLEVEGVGMAILDMGRRAQECGLLVPSELTLLGKTLLQLDEVGRLLDPTFDPAAAVGRNLDDLMSKRIRGGVDRGSVFNSILDLKGFLGRLPRQLNRALDSVTKTGLEVQVRTPDARSIMDGLQKIANRVTAGVILAALIVGASLLMRVETRFQLFGYPGLAMLCFLGAAGGGVWLLLSIFLQDRRTRRTAPKPHP